MTSDKSNKKKTKYRYKWSNNIPTEKDVQASYNGYFYRRIGITSEDLFDSKISDSEYHIVTWIEDIIQITYELKNKQMILGFYSNNKYQYLIDLESNERIQYQAVKQPNDD